MLRNTLVPGLPRGTEAEAPSVLPHLLIGALQRPCTAHVCLSARQTLICMQRCSSTRPGKGTEAEAPFNHQHQQPCLTAALQMMSLMQQYASSKLGKPLGCSCNKLVASHDSTEALERQPRRHADKASRKQIMPGKIAYELKIECCVQQAVVHMEGEVYIAATAAAAAIAADELLRDAQHIAGD